MNGTSSRDPNASGDDGLRMVELAAAIAASAAGGTSVRLDCQVPT